MGYDYTKADVFRKLFFAVTDLIHGGPCQWTIAIALALSLIYRPLSNHRDAYKVLLVTTTAAILFISWNLLNIHMRTWTYSDETSPELMLFGTTVEEISLLFAQAYITSFLYLLLSKPTFHSIYLQFKSNGEDGGTRARNAQRWRRVGQIVTVLSIIVGLKLVAARGAGLYFGLILICYGPYLLLSWSFNYQYILGLPTWEVLVPIALPTVYMWIVYAFVIEKKVRVIKPNIKLGIQLCNGQEIEEFVFVLISNTLIVFGLIAFDKALAILDTFSSLFPVVPTLPSPFLLVKALLLPASAYDDNRIRGLQQAFARLKMKSRSFHLANGLFQGRLRIDIILLYSFCRVADDLVDNASSVSEARHWIHQLTEYLNIAYPGSHTNVANHPNIRAFVENTFPEPVQSSLLLLPTAHLSPAPLFGLLEGFKTDLKFSASSSTFPINDVSDLNTYAARVAGTVAELCVELVYQHTTPQVANALRERLISAGGRMGIALQYVNVARDITVDARMGRVYIPSSWLKEEGLGPDEIVKAPESRALELLRRNLLNEAMRIYNEARDAIEELPYEVRGPLRVAVESYMEIGRVLLEKGFSIQAGRATVPKLRRLKVAYYALAR